MTKRLLISVIFGIFVFSLGTISPGLEIFAQEEELRAVVLDEYEDEDGVFAVLYAGVDQYTRNHDIFAVDPVSETTINLTNGEIRMENGWSQPWEPVGNQHKVVFRQFRRTGFTYEGRIFVLEVKKGPIKIVQIPEIFDRVCSITWSNDNRTFAFLNQYGVNSSQNEVVIIKDKQVEARIPIGFYGSCWAKWSPDGKWIAVISRLGEGLLLVSTENYSVTQIPLEGSPSGGGASSWFAWGFDSLRLALVLEGILSIIDLEGNALQTFGEAYGVDDWSANGKYISYLTRDPYSWGRQSVVLFLGGSEEVASGYEDENCGMWSPNSELLAFWAWGEWLPSLMVVGPDGKNPKVIGTAHPAGYMSPSWVKLTEDLPED
ncbi:MAG: hypothetical protein ACFFCW_10470 [Candidatus Hodarchaeota archaeon]